MIAGALFTKSSHPLLTRYRPHFRGLDLVLSFVTVAELRFGAYSDGWGQERIAALEDRFRRVSGIAMPDNDLVEQQARLRTACKRAGHALHDKIHEADRWIAATAIRYGLPLVSDDAIFVGVPGLSLRREP